MSKTTEEHDETAEQAEQQPDSTPTSGSGTPRGSATGGQGSTSRTTVSGETAEETKEEWVTYEFDGEAKVTTTDLNVHYGNDHAIKNISMEIPEKSVTAFIGPSGCGKSTFLRCLNRMNDRIRSASVDGSVTLDGKEIYQDGANLVELRKRVGMVFQQPNPFPKSIRDNIAYGPRKHGDIKTGLLARLLDNDSKEKEDELV